MNTYIVKLMVVCIECEYTTIHLATASCAEEAKSIAYKNECPHDDVMQIDFGVLDAREHFYYKATSCEQVDPQDIEALNKYIG